MRSRKFILFTVILSVLGTGSVLASQEDMSESILKYANSKYHRGDGVSAFESFSQALILNPYNQEAQQGLLQFLSEAHLSSQQQINLIQFQDLINLNKELEKRIEYYRSKINLLEEEIVHHGVDKEIFKEKQQFAKTINLKHRPVRSTSINNNALELVNSSLNQDKEHLLETLADLQKYFEFLRKVNKDSQKDFAKTPVTGIEINPIPVEDELTVLKREVIQVHKKLDQLTNQVVDLTLKLSEKNLYSERQEDRLNALSNNFVELKSRFELGEKMMNEKDGQIQTLQDQVKQIQAQAKASNDDLNNILTSKDEKLFELNGILQVYKGKLTDTVHNLKEKNATLTTLEDQLDIAQTKYVQKNKAIEQVKNNIVTLQDSLKDIEDHLTQLKGFKPSSQITPSLTETRQQIADLKSKLDQVARYLKLQLESANKAVPLTIHD